MNTDRFGYEIDFLPVGNGERSGDAIAVRYGSSATGYVVMVVDGGTNESGEAIVELVRRHYRTNHVNYVVNTHPDADHASGLAVVLNSLSVGQLWMHQPWLHSSEMLHLFRSGRLTSSGLARRTREALGAAWDLAKVAKRHNVQVREPFQGAQIGAFRVLSPEREWYKTLVSQFRDTPQPQPVVTSELGLGLKDFGNASGVAARDVTGLADLDLDRRTDRSAFGNGFGVVARGATGLADLDLGRRTGLNTFGNAFRVAARDATASIQWVAETMNVETLGYDVTTSAENESSVVLYGELGERGVLLTGDAGVLALTCAADYAEGRGFHLRDLDLMQVPHHGSRNNVTPIILNRVMGSVACASAAKASSTHPRRVVTNAFIRRRATVYTTEGTAICFPWNMPGRVGYEPAESVPFYDRVEG